MPVCAFDEILEEELVRSCEENDVIAIDKLLRRPQDTNGPSLFVAAENGHLEVVRLLLEAGADENSERTDGATAMFLAAEEGHLEVVRSLLEAGADKESAKMNGTAALSNAAETKAFASCGNVARGWS